MWCYVGTCSHLSLFMTFWHQRGPRWPQMAPGGPRWSQMVPNGSRWLHISPSESREASGASFLVFLGPAGQMALRRSLEAHFEYFWGLLAKWLSGGFCRCILSISGACWPNGIQWAFRGSFRVFLVPPGKIALWRHPEVHFEYF